MSYINNLHPKHHAGLYTTIEKVLEKGLPMWDLIDRWHGDYETLRIPYRDEAKRDEDEFNDDYGGYSAEEPSRELWRRDKIWFERTQPIERLLPKDVNLDSGFFNQADRIQVIVKLVNIHLTPEKPTYNSRS
ncbi:metalloprotease [Colletotrichum asianum]|uniref:Metalloprotease n=1 Tax=Colletotrichum asianum TaxID=702518 RepID=A0A8H3W4W7_9PEZI|nr:metalloprotease [Colletotrichum asianum]